MMLKTLLFALLTTCSTASLAGNWIALGPQDIHGELDLDSIDTSASPARAHMRVQMEIDGDILVMYQAQEVYCEQSMIYLTNGMIQKVGHPKVVNMPDLPQHERVTRIPAENPGLNAMFDYICNR
jgi:hypothetical protein